MVGGIRSDVGVVLLRGVISLQAFQFKRLWFLRVAVLQVVRFSKVQGRRAVLQVVGFSKVHGDRVVLRAARLCFNLPHEFCCVRACMLGSSIDLTSFVFTVLLWSPMYLRFFANCSARLAFSRFAFIYVRACI